MLRHMLRKMKWKQNNQDDGKWTKKQNEQKYTFTYNRIDTMFAICVSISFHLNYKTFDKNVIYT